MSNNIFLTAIGNNEPGIIATISATLVTYNISIADITQKILDDKFVVFMILEPSATLNIQNLETHLVEATKRYRVKITLAHENLFNAMHRI